MDFKPAIRNFANRLITAGTRYYVYDVEGTRIKTQKGEDTTEFVYNVNARLSQLLIKTENNAVTKYVYGLGLIGEETSGNFKTYHFDYRGSTVAITNANGTVTDTFEYDTYGKLTAHSGSNNTQFLYNGRDGVMTEDTGLIYMRARYYSTALRRFINADKVHGDITNSLSLNRYSFVNGNPAVNVDPEGLSAERVGVGATIAASAAARIDFIVDNEPEHNEDDSGNKNFWKIVGGVAIIGALGIATIFTGGTAAVICGAAFTGAVAGGASGTIFGAIGGALSNGWQGAIDGACSGFLSGTIFGGISGAVSSSFNLLRGATKVIGKAHGSLLHKFASNVEAGKMVSSGKYSTVSLNKALKTVGLNGSKRPDVIGVMKDGMGRIIEVTSPRQSSSYISNKMAEMLADNPGSSGKIISWVRNLFK